jgi:hypothetical protein
MTNLQPLDAKKSFKMLCLKKFLSKSLVDLCHLVSVFFSDRCHIFVIQNLTIPTAFLNRHTKRDEDDVDKLRESIYDLFW